MEEGEELFAVTLDPVADMIPGGKGLSVANDELILGFS